MAEPLPPHLDQSPPFSGKPSARNGLVLVILFGGLALTLFCLVAAGALAFVFLRDGGPAQQTATGVEEPSAQASAGLQSMVDRIAFIEPRGRLATVAPDGSDPRILTTPGVRFQFPAWSPDGTQLAAVGSRQGAGSIYVVADAIDGPSASLSEIYSSTSRTPFYLYWSPDSRQVSFLANDPQGIALHLAPADGSSESRVLATGQPFYWDWAQDGDQLFIHTGGLGENARLTFIDTQGEPQGDELGNPGLFQAPGISPSGRYLAFAGADEDGLRVILQDQAGDQHVEVPHRGVAAMGWSPTQDQLAFISPQSRSPSFFGPLRLVDAVTGDARTLTRDLVIAFFWSPDGRSIAYLSPDLGSTEPGARFPTDLRSVNSGFWPASNAMQSGEVRLRLSVVDVESSQRRQLSSFEPTSLFISQFIPFFDQYALSHRIWSPDSRSLVMPMVDGSGREQVYVIPVDGAAAVPIANGSIGFWSHQ
jgi:TolB protein